MRLQSGARMVQEVKERARAALEGWELHQVPAAEQGVVWSSCCWGMHAGKAALSLLPSRAAAAAVGPLEDAGRRAWGAGLGGAGCRQYGRRAVLVDVCGR